MSTDEFMLYVDMLLNGNEYWTMRSDGTRKRVDPATVTRTPARTATQPAAEPTDSTRSADGE